MPLPGFPITLKLPVIWGDQDLFGHVNNTIYLRWFESARVAFWDNTGIRDLMTPRQCGPILASIHCNYRRQLRYPDTVEIGARVVRIGRTSMTLEHAACSDALGTIAADGESVVVLFNYARQQPEVIQDDLRAILEGLQTSPKPANP